MSEIKNDKAWEKLFDKYKISENVLKKGYFEITSSQINKFREARLMTKFDFRSQLPKIFSENKFSILPISRGSYIISDFETFQDFETNNPTPIKVEFPGYIESINYNDITSESIALNCAYVTGIIQHFVQDESIKPTISGRMSSLDFNFKIKTRNSDLKINVNNSQIEIDGGFEGVESLSLIEAKNSISKDFLIRQLYYPYKLWNRRISKNVRPIFLTYSNGVFHFREYHFEEENNYNSLRLKREEKYIIRDSIINLELIQKISNEIRVKNEPNISFPQADSFERIINLCELLRENETLTRDEITLNYDFDVRQTSYYTDAGRYLGLIDKSYENGVCYFLTDLGKQIFELNISERQIEFIKLILSHKVFNVVIKKYFRDLDLPKKEEVTKVMKTSNLYRIDSEKTFKRRASTILSWINWILDQREE